jgi:electron transfer flavoprotein alpha subunit
MSLSTTLVVLAFGSADRALTGLAGAARALADSQGEGVTALVAGPSSDEAATVLAPLVDRLQILAHPSLGTYQPERFLEVLAAACGSVGSRVVLMAGDTYCQELAPRLAHRLGGVAAADVVALSVAGGCLDVRRAVYGGKAEAVFRLRRLPAVVWIRARGFAPPSPRQTPAARETVAVAPPEAASTRLVDRATDTSGGVRLEDASRIVSGGRGVGSAEGFEPLQRLAKLLGAQMAATRAPCDAGWVPASWQVGQTGKKVAPDLYLAVGLSGSSQHLLGISDAKVIAAINLDQDAPIFRHSQFGLVEDLRKAVPLLCDKLTELGG